MHEFTIAFTVSIALTTTFALRLTLLLGFPYSAFILLLLLCLLLGRHSHDVVSCVPLASVLSGEYTTTAMPPRRHGFHC